MRFDDWLAKWEALRDELFAMREKGIVGVYPPGWEEREEEHLQIARRVYLINSRLSVTINYQRPLEYDCGVPNRGAVFHPSIRRSYKGDEWIDTNPMLHHFSTQELCHLADMLDTSDRWESGLIDEMPPSGAWRLPKPSCRS